jgi:hypothetical protein
VKSTSVYLKRSVAEKLMTAVCAVALSLTLAHAATLTNVPMQGGMVMPMLAYHAGDGSLRVQVDPAVPQLTPLLVSNAGDTFDPADPWYGCLDPRAEGLAFSRRYGFVMDAATDPLPAGTAIWIRKLSGSPGLEAYRYRNTEPKAWEPIFGTNGSTNALQWNGMMFHPGFTAPPGTGMASATFEAFLVDSGTGLAVPGANTGPFTLNWTVVPDGRPDLDIALRLVIAWPAAATNYVLESADTLPSGQWTLVETAPVIVDGQSAVVLESGAAKKFYRMRLAP